MSDVVRRAESVTGEPEVGPGVGLDVVGHGTERNATAAKATEYHVDRIADRDRFEGVVALFMNEAPSVADLTDHLDSTDVVLVPLFIADGYHTREYIREDVGLIDDYRTGWETPAEVGGHRVWYAGDVGTEPPPAEAQIERAADASADVEDPLTTVRRRRGDRFRSGREPLPGAVPAGETGRRRRAALWRAERE